MIDVTEVSPLAEYYSYEAPLPPTSGELKSYMQMLNTIAYPSFQIH